MPPTPVEQWRAPRVLQAKSVVSAAVGIVVAAVFFPLWIAIPVSVALGAWGLGMCARRPTVLLDAEAGRLTVRMGPLTRRVALAEVSAVQLERAKVTIGKADGTAISFYAWRKSRLDGWLKVPEIASDVAHAISKAAAAASAPAEPTGMGVTRDRSGKNLPVAAVACTGLLEIAAVFFVHVKWGNPAMTALGTVVALALGFAGVFSVVIALWTFLTGRTRMSKPAV